MSRLSFVVAVLVVVSRLLVESEARRLRGPTGVKAQELVCNITKALLACEVYPKDSYEDTDDDTDGAIAPIDLLNEYRGKVFANGSACEWNDPCFNWNEIIIHDYVYVIKMCEDQVEALADTFECYKESMGLFGRSEWLSILNEL